MKSEDNSHFEIEVLNPDIDYADLTYKIIIIGDSGVGKSCLTIQAIENKFVDYNVTVGFEIKPFNIRINKLIIKLQIWDTCGQEVYRSLINGLYRNSSLAIILYSVTNKNSFQHIESWLKDVRLNALKNVKTILVGNMIDLEKERKISYTEGENFKNKYNLDYFIETSAKTGDNAKNVLIEAAKILYRQYITMKDKEENKKEENENNLHILDKEKNEEKKIVNKKKKCC